ncbi:MAG: glutaredoxin family protein [Gammaproteobacteria bacterium]
MLDAWFNKPKIEITRVERDPEAQAAVDAATAGMALYHYDTCMFCARVRKAIDALGLNIELRDVMHDRGHYRDLALNGGRTTVPCLLIGKDDPATGQWMYESADIIAWLGQRFGA